MGYKEIWVSLLDIFPEQLTARLAYISKAVGSNLSAVTNKKGVAS